MLETLKQSIFSNRTKSFLDYATAVLFGICFLSIPLFSFLDRLNLLTWLFSILFFVFAFTSILLHYKFKITIISMCFILFLISAFLSCVFVGFKGFSFSTFLNTLVIFIVYTYCISSNKQNNKKMLISAYVGIVIFSLIFIAFYAKELIHMEFDRLGEKFGDVNDIAIITSLGFFAAIYFSFFAKKWMKIPNILAALLIVVVSFSTGSKISLILIACSFLLTIFFKFGKKKWYISISFVGAFIVALVLILTIPAFETLKDRFLNMIYTFLGLQYKNQNPDTSSLMRGEMFLNGISLFLRRPLFGNGTNGFRTFSSFNGWSHNHWSDSLANYGIIGTLLYHVPLVLVFYKSRYITNKKDGCIYIIFASLMIISSISVALFNEKFFTYSIGVILSSVDVRKKELPLLELLTRKKKVTN